MKDDRVAVIPGDGIGKEVVPEGLRVRISIRRASFPRCSSGARLGDRSIQAAADIFAGEKLQQRFGIDDGSGQAVIPDLTALFR